MNPNKKRKIVFAPATELGYLSYYTDQVLKAVCEISEVPFEGVFISDESTIDHFPIEKKDLPKLKELLDVDVKLDDTFLDVARRMKKALG